ncbi:hypothetical protein Pan181_15700 [Aeoliella mucimassa]|uniref:Uncharacterized protein n=1 Tax=Aeoliella mucimassa TaxID=2527972 RepID=A0A518AKZ7_9BACT|nr:hypothetical protein Pan181_15700 [Aeoliella mucimassa]
MSNNPFQSPLEQTHPPTAIADKPATNDIQVDGNCLVVKPGAVLPNRCIRTNEPTPPQDRRRQTLYWLPVWLVVVAVLTLPLLPIVYFGTRKVCTITYSESRKSRARRHAFVVHAILVGIGLFLGMLISTSHGMWNASVVTTVGFLFTLIVTAFAARGPLKITRHNNNRFWINGFSSEYISALESGPL